MKRRWFLVAAFYGCLLLGGWLLGSLLPSLADFQVRPINEPETHRMIMAISAIFVVASALPFVPGAELGFGLIATLGERIAFLVYVCMVSALTLAFFLGRLIDPRLLAVGFRYLGLNRSANLVVQCSELEPEDRLPFLAGEAPNRILPLLLKYRYLALAITFNIPGNSLIGGGGGLALFAGMSGLFSPLGFLLTAAIAVAPVPLLIVLTGYQP